MLLHPTRSEPSAVDGGEAMQPPAEVSAARLWSSAERLQTFQNGGWPLDFLRAEDVAGAGFFSLRRGDDAVQCAYCGVVVSHWEPSDDPLTEHAKWSPQCPFLRSRRPVCADARPHDTCTVQPSPPSAPTPTQVHSRRPVWPQYCTRHARLESFRDWPPSIPVKPAILSEAGFFYSGNGDRTVCYYCGGRLRDWEPNDDPWVEHELWFPGCSHIFLHRGKDFVKHVADNRDALIAAKKNHSAVTKETATGVPESLKQDEPAKDQNKSTNESRLCKICYENDMGVVFLPCGHIVACVDCALSVSSCPMCRKPFESTTRVYLS